MKNKRTRISDLNSNIVKNKRTKIPYPLVFPILVPILVPILFPLIFMGIMFSFFEPPEPKVRYIEVNGQDCHIEYVKGKCNSHGGCSWHDKAVCP